MKKFSKHLLSLVMILALLCTVMVMPAMAEGTDPVMIGSTVYSSLANALAEAATMSGDVTVEIYDKVTLNTSLSGSYDSIKFVGKDTDAEIYLEVQGYITATGKKVGFEDLTLSKSESGFITNAGFMNVAFGVYDVTEVTYTNCTFTNGAYASSGKVSYTGCIFKRSHDKYGLWAYGNVDVIVDDCTFSDYRGIKMYAEGAAKTVDLTVKNTNFSAVNDKPAIVLTYGKSVTLENNTYSSTGVFELDLDGAPNGTPVTSDMAPTCENDNGACGVLVDGKIYTTVAQAAEAATSGSVITLLHASTETVALPEGVSLEKNGYTADGVTVTNPVASIGSDNIYASLQAAVTGAQSGDTVTLLKSTAGSGIVINKNVTIDFGSYTYTFTEPAVGSSGTESNGFQILKDNNVTLQNGTLNVDAAYAEKYYILIQNYANLNVTNMVLDGTNLDKWSKVENNYDSYVLSNNCGTVNINGNTSIIANNDGSLAYAVDAHLKSGYTAPTVTIDTTGTINGKIEISGGTMIVENGTFHARKVNGAYTDTDVFVVSSGLLTINKAAVDGGDKEDTTAVWVHTSGKAVINGGSFTLSGKNVTSGHNDMIYAGKTNDGTGAVIEVNGGTFSATDVKDPGTNGANVWLLNEKDGQGSMTVSGGIFEGFNPGAVYTEPTQPTSFLAEGYCVDTSSTSYIVGKHNSDSFAFDNDSHWKVCSNCGKANETVEKEPHGEFVVDPEDLSSQISVNECVAFYVKQCPVCGKDGSYEDRVAVPLENPVHAWNEGTVTTAPTCTEDGVMTYSCTTPGCTATKTESIPAAHQFGDWQPKQDATCTEAGHEDHFKCNVCGHYKVLSGDEYIDAEEEDVIIPATDHTEVAIPGKAATCTETGLTEGKKCSVCGTVTVEQKVIDKIAHTEVAVPGKAATCTETGLTEGKKCSVCGITTVAQNAIPATGHKGGEATCEKNPVCEVCGEEYIGTTGVGHTLQLVEAKAPTCTEAGIMEHSLCIHCGKTFTSDDKFEELTSVAVPATGHAEVTVPGKAATCTETGLTEGKKCSVCGTVTVEQTVIDKIAHTEVAVPSKAATCTETGLTEGKKCSVCGTVTLEQKVIEALGHKLETVAATEATYFAPGNIEYSKCSVCGKLFDAEGKELAAADVVIAQLIKIEETKAEVSTDVVEDAIADAKTEGTVNIVINVTNDKLADQKPEEEKPEGDAPGEDTTPEVKPEPAPVVTKAELPAAAVEQIAELHEEATLTVTMTNATVTMDKTTLEVVAEAAKTEESATIALEIEHIETESLAPAQQEAIEEKEVAAVISASILVNDTEVHDFKGGEVTVAIPFTPAEGTNGSDYVVLYIADDGSVEEIPTAYENGVLTMTLSHFSEYVVVNTNVTVKPPVDPDVPNTGDTTDMMMLSSILVLSMSALAVLVLNKKKFLA